MIFFQILLQGLVVGSILSHQEKIAICDQIIGQGELIYSFLTIFIFNSHVSRYQFLVRNVMYHLDTETVQPEFLTEGIKWSTQNPRSLVNVDGPQGLNLAVQTIRTVFMT